MISMNYGILAPTLFVITGPSGVGKGSIIRKLLDRYQKIWLSISATTRKPREGEIEGRDYFFIEKNEFQQLIKDKGLLEWAEFAGNFYGTPVKEVSQKIEKGIKVILEIELAGARQVKKSFPQAKLIFIAPPEFNELEKRIRGRGTESEDSIKRRLLKAKEEIEAKNEFDEIIVNDDLEKAILSLANKMNLSKNNR
tara:strand:- start:370 stop:957 length:588 start_codon:yes stop_codon:yes gene_type:complete